MKYSNFILGIKNFEEGFEVLYRYRPFGIFLTSHFKYKDPKEIKEFIKDLKKFAGYDLKIATDQEGGYASWIFKDFPSPSEWAQKDFSEFEKDIKEMAFNLKDIGVDINFAPCVDICYDEENEIICKKKRSFGKTPQIVSKYAVRFFGIMQKKGISCCAKHFINQARASEDPHRGFPVSDCDLKEIEKDFLPYEILIKKGIKYIMAGFIKYKKISDYPVLFSEYFLKEILKKKLLFKGKVITDDLLMGGILKNYSLKEAIELSFKAGCDLILISDAHNLKSFSPN